MSFKTENVRINLFTYISNLENIILRNKELNFQKKGPCVAEGSGAQINLNYIEAQGQLGL